ncbi:hypothetical protein E4U40_006143 [Claviceps sp. LM458 group G5]|nr:hypothetical protein E4U40_006143 [Claviceps sp. LM458 group G5]
MSRMQCQERQIQTQSTPTSNKNAQKVSREAVTEAAVMAVSAAATTAWSRRWILDDRSAFSDMKNPADYYKPDNIVKVLIPISIVGWLAFGAICVLCLNGHGRAGRWIPEWYLDSGGSRWDKAAVGAWWLAVVFAWPVILPSVAVRSLSGRLRRWRANGRGRGRGRGRAKAKMECVENVA